MSGSRATGNASVLYYKTTVSNLWEVRSVLGKAQALLLSPNLRHFLGISLRLHTATTLRRLSTRDHFSTDVQVQQGNQSTAACARAINLPDTAYIQNCHIFSLLKPSCMGKTQVSFEPRSLAANVRPGQLALELSTGVIYNRAGRTTTTSSLRCLSTIVPRGGAVRWCVLAYRRSNDIIAGWDRQPGRYKYIITQTRFWDPLSALVWPCRSPHLGPELVNFFDDELLHSIYRVLFFEEKVEFLSRGSRQELYWGL